MNLRIRSTHLSTVISISLVLFLLGLTAILLLNASHFSNKLREHITVSVLLRDELPQTELTRLKKQLDVAPYVREARIVSKEEAAQKLQEEFGDNFIDVLGFNPLPTTIDFKLQLAYSNPDSVLAIESRLKMHPSVKTVYYPKAMVGTIDQSLRKIGFVMLFFAVLLMLISIGLINNWVRIAIYSDRFLIRTQELVGATGGFISRPYVWQAIAQGIIGGILAMAMLTAFVWFVQGQTAGVLTVHYLLWVYLLLVVSGVLFSSVAAYFAVRKYLNIKLEQLYT